MCEHKHIYFDNIENEIVCIDCGECVDGENIAI